MSAVTGRLTGGARRLALIAAGTCLSGGATASHGARVWPDAPRQSWRAAATEEDRQRLRDWRTVWLAALAAAPAGAAASDPALFDPDDGVDGALPSGDYRCRRIAIGDGAVAAAAWGACTVVAQGPFAGFTGPAGPSRVVGRIYPDTARRSVFLGSVQFADERAAPRHGQMAGRDLAGLVERIGEARWRLALPRAPFGGAMQIVELVR